MAIVSTVILSDAGNPRRIAYQCTDDTGGLHKYGPVITTNLMFDAEAHKTVVAEKVASGLAEAEFNALLGV